MGHRIGMAIVCLHISAVLYILVGVLALAAGIEFVFVGLRRRKLWDWIAGLCVFNISQAVEVLRRAPSGPDPP